MTVINLHGLEWHDGWLASILDLVDGKIVAALAVAVDWNNHIMRLALCEITREQADLLVNYHSNDGFSPQFKMAWRNALMASTVYLVDEEPRKGDELHWSEATVAQRERLSVYELPLVETASAPEALHFWLK